MQLGSLLHICWVRFPSFCACNYIVQLNFMLFPIDIHNLKSFRSLWRFFLLKAVLIHVDMVDGFRLPSSFLACFDQFHI